jgi:DNA-binding NtrC family response regulator
LTVLIADDDQNIITALKLLLKSEGLDSVSCNTPKAALELVQKQAFQLALIDLNYHEDTTSGKEGLDLISAIRKVDEYLPIIVMTGWGTVSVAVEAMQRGAMDFVEKPWDENNRLIAAIRTQIRLAEIAKSEIKLQIENKILRSEKNNLGNMVCESPAMKSLLKIIDKVAASDISILITGENGTGKSLLASYIHEHSQRAAGPFVSVNMGGISEPAFESEMFGHIKGAFTDAKHDRIGRIELADRGTLFMDEIANMPTSQQAKILRVLEEYKYEKLGSSQERSVSVRVISATNADLARLTEEEGFRTDLLYRLNGVTLEIPALRDRVADILPMAEKFLQAAISHYESPAKSFSIQAVEALENYGWPGNVRELKHVVERAVLLCLQEEISVSELQLPTLNVSADAQLSEEFFTMSLEQAESWYIKRVIESKDGNSTQAAKTLEISRSSLYRRLGKSGK